MLTNRIWPEFEEFRLLKELILATPEGEYTRQTLQELDALLELGLLFDHWSPATLNKKTILQCLHTEALQDLQHAVRKALGIERGDMV